MWYELRTVCASFLLFWPHTGQIWQLSTVVRRSITSVGLSKTIRKQPLVKAQTALRKPKNMAKTIFNMADGILRTCNVARSWHWFRQVTAPCNVAGCSGITCTSIRRNVRHIGILLLFQFRPYHCSQHVILHQSAKFYPNRTTLGRKKWRHVDFQDGGSPPFWILRVQ